MKVFNSNIPEMQLLEGLIKKPQKVKVMNRFLSLCNINAHLLNRYLMTQLLMYINKIFDIFAVTKSRTMNNKTLISRRILKKLFY